MGEEQHLRSVGLVQADPRLLYKVGREFARRTRIVPLKRVGALTLVGAPDMWARLEAIDHLEATLGPVSFVQLTPGR